MYWREIPPTSTCLATSNNLSCKQLKEEDSGVSFSPQWDLINLRDADGISCSISYRHQIQKNTIQTLNYYSKYIWTYHWLYSRVTLFPVSRKTSLDLGEIIKLQSESALYPDQKWIFALIGSSYYSVSNVIKSSFWSCRKKAIPYSATTHYKYYYIVSE